ncbi:hypothetical protein DXG03_006854 [Asterophora parasitica]|uniref:Phosphoglycerate mutase family protein n=1 Tax=Asterophora parasitica TaxID=117018 RepID=A0A9P7G6T8_9AGAR|nr:hypothetical protein DXG03_006854 [Asterophora parasitica]
MTEDATDTIEAPNKRFRSYTTVPGFFIQDEPTTRASAIPPRFGLLDDSADRWDKFFAHLAGLDESADRYTSYKVFFLGRHGQGVHNVAEAKYGTKAWDE